MWRLKNGPVLPDPEGHVDVFVLTVSRQELLYHLTELKGYEIILGYSTKIKVNKNKLLNNLFNLIDFFLDETNQCVSLEINPLFVYESSVKVIDCVMEKKVSY